MVKRALVLAVAAVFCAASFAMAADEAKKAVPAMQKPAAGQAIARQMPPKSDFSMISGKVEKIDSSDPANVRITVKNDKDNTSRTLTVMPWTNITKSAEISDLKTGEAVRVMARKSQDKDIAMGIMFGKINMPPPPRTAQAVPQGSVKAASPVKAPVKK